MFTILLIVVISNLPFSETAVVFGSCYQRVTENMGMSPTYLSFAWVLCTGICSYFLLVQEFAFHLVEFPACSKSEDVSKNVQFKILVPSTKKSNGFTTFCLPSNPQFQHPKVRFSVNSCMQHHPFHFLYLVPLLFLLSLATVFCYLEQCWSWCATQHLRDLEWTYPHTCLSAVMIQGFLRSAKRQILYLNTGQPPINIIRKCRPPDPCPCFSFPDLLITLD